MPHRVELQRGNDPNVCPVKALEDFIFLRGRAVGPLFFKLLSVGRTPLQRRGRTYHRSCPFVDWTTNGTSPTVSGSAQLLTRPSGASRTPR